MLKAQEKQDHYIVEFNTVEGEHYQIWWDGEDGEFKGFVHHPRNYGEWKNPYDILDILRAEMNALEDTRMESDSEV